MTRNEMLYVEIKNELGEFEPLGVMTLKTALEIAWKRDHAAIQYTPVHGTVAAAGSGT